MLLPRILKLSKSTGFFPFTVILTVFKCVFMLMSTPGQIVRKRCGQHIPVIVPCTMVPFFSSIVTVSFVSFIKNLVGMVSR